MLGKAKAPPSPSFESIQSQLTAIPIPNHEVEKDLRRDLLLVKVQLRYKGINKLFAKLLKLATIKQYQIDGVSFELYQLMDGKRNIEDLIDFLSEKYQLSFFESRGLILHYLHILTQKGVIVIGGTTPLL